MDSTQANAGQFQAYVNGNASLWQLERKTHTGPVFGEGGFHWYWSGLLDGVEAQTAMGVAGTSSSKLPLFVDFDLLNIHPLQVNHGMGYYSRWAGPGEDIHRTDLADAYRMQELIFGHAPYIESDFWSVVPRVLVENNLVGPVAKRYGTQKVAGIQYQFKGNWSDATNAAKANDWSRVQVRYANGDVIVANSQTAPMAWQGYTLPQSGWLAQGNGLLAYTALRGNTIVDYAETPVRVFANARNQMDLYYSLAMAKPSVISAKQTTSGTIVFSVQWQVLDSIPNEDLIAFIHIYMGNQIAFQCGGAPSVPSSSWQPGKVVATDYTCTVPQYVGDGTYSLGLGLYSQSSGQRYTLAGSDDGNCRYFLGNVLIGGNPRKVSFLSSQTVPFAADARMNPTGSVVDFDTVRTDGMVSLSFDGVQWELRSYPRHRDVVIQLRSSRFPFPRSINCPSSIGAPSIKDSGNGYWEIHTNAAKSCRW